MEDVRVQMLGDFIIHAGGMQHDQLPGKSRKGVSLITYLVLQNEKSIASRRLIRELWGNTYSVNPENALKTMVSRTRGMLKEIDPRLSDCIVSEKGAYRWENKPGVTVDAVDFLTELHAAKQETQSAERERHYKQAMALYPGDLFQTGDMVDGAFYVNYLHHEYLEAVYAYVDLLKKREAYIDVCNVCRAAMKVDDFDDQLHIELMRAMVNLNQHQQAMEEYKYVTMRTKRFLGENPSDDMKEYYQQLTKTGQKLRFNLDAIKNELQAEEADRTGPFICDYRAFKEIYNIQMRNLERLGSTMFLAVIMLGDPEEQLSTVKQESGIAALLEILKTNLRRGDIVTRFSGNTVAMLLPTVNYETGSMVMERMETLFFEQYPGTDISFHYRISPMSSETL